VTRAAALAGTESESAEPAPPRARSPIMRAVDHVGWPRIRRGAVIVYALAWLAILLGYGVPTGRNIIAVLLVTGATIPRIGYGWRAYGRSYLDWLPFVAVLIAYDKTRAVADTVGLPLHESDVLGWEKALFGGHVPTVWLQQHLYDAHQVMWYDAAFTLVYTTHFLATPALAAVLYIRSRVMWRQYISRVVLLSVAGLITYVLFPEAPPWMASRDGLIGFHIERLSARGWIWLHVSNLQQTLAHAQEAGSNAVAAMPSLHAGFACLVAIFAISKLRSQWRWLFVGYPLAMGLTLVYQGEHYVVDLLAGYAYALAVHFGMNQWERHRAQKARAAVPSTASGELTAG
jgi:hypothetical protein